MKLKVEDTVKVIHDDEEYSNFDGKIKSIDESEHHIDVLFENGEKIGCEECNLDLIKNKKTFKERGTVIGELVDTKQKAYGDSVTKAYELMKIFLKDYKNDDNTYTIPESLLRHLLLQVRIIDKQNRIFSNPEGDMMSENPYQDTVGYGLIGVRMVDEMSDNND